MTACRVDESPPAATGKESACQIREPTSVEARFGLHSCNPRGEDSHTDIELGEWALDGRGRVQAGVLAVLADHTLGEVPYLRRPPATWAVTTELTIDFARPAEPGETLHARATPTRMEQGGGLVHGVITDAGESVAALATTRCVFVAATRDAPPPSAPGVKTDRTATSIAEHLGLAPIATDAGVGLQLRDVDSWVNDFGILHGGIWTCMTEMAAAAAVSEKNPTLSTAQIKIVFFRSAPLGSAVTVYASPIHVGGRFAVVEVSGHTDDGTLCTKSTVTFRGV